MQSPFLKYTNYFNSLSIPTSLQCAGLPEYHSNTLTLLMKGLGVNLPSLQTFPNSRERKVLSLILLE